MDALGSFGFSPGALLAGLIFGGIGWLIFKEGRKRTHFELYTVGLLLMVYPYFISHEIGVWVVGVLLTIVAVKLMQQQ